MTSQPPLLDRTGPTLVGPQFTPRPGWGGRLGRWFSHNAYIVVFRIVILVALVLITRSLFVQRNDPLAQTPTVSPDAASLRPISIKAAAGDGMTHLAARALDLYSALQSPVIRLDGARHLFAVDALSRLVGWFLLEIDQIVTFSATDISAVIERAQSLTPAQLAAWERWLR